MSPNTPTASTDSRHATAFAVTGAFVTNARHGQFARRALIVALMAHGFFTALFMALNVALMVWLNLASIALYFTCIGLARRNHNGWVSGLVIVALLGHAAIATRAVGWASGFQLYAWLLIPSAALSTRSSPSKKICLVVLASLACMAIDPWLQRVPALTKLPPKTIRFLHTFNLGAYFAIMAVLAFVYAQTVAEAERILHRQATTDSLTGLRNRRRLLELARGELARARRSGAPVSIIVADVDHFKSINDRFGHLTGDQVIIGIAQCLHQCVRQQDHTARWGGEEFIMVLPDIDLQGAYAAAERMRQSIEQLRVPTDADTVCCTASFGVSEWKHGRGETFEQCLDRADAALYSAKQLGRNRVCLSQPPALTEHGVADVLSASNPANNAQPTPAASHATQVMPAHRNAS